jgi:competence protein ComEA
MAGSGAVPRIRLDAGRRGVIAVGLALLLVAAATAWWVFLGRPRASAVPVITSARGAVSSSAAAARPGSVPASVVVDVVGKVRRPGVYRLRSGARVQDAVQAAGGATAGADLTPTNLARKLVDGEQIAVGLAPAGATGSTGLGAEVTGSGGLVDLNTASAEQLDELPGVGPVLAQHILDWRSAHGRFDSADQLREVSGIGPSKFADLRPLVTV